MYADRGTDTGMPFKPLLETHYTEAVFAVEDRRNSTGLCLTIKRVKIYPIAMPSA
jgi:hypothetical protein